MLKPAPSIPNPCLDTLLGYARRGHYVIPINSDDGGQCSCGKADCDSVGKHPLTLRGVLDATRDEGQIAYWYQKYPDCNWAICTGPESGLIVLDIDGVSGKSSLEWIEKEYGDSGLNTLRVQTPHGEHCYFRYPENGGKIQNSVKRIAPGLDIRGWHGYVLVPPSKLHDGQYLRMNDAPILPAPNWLLQAIKQVGNHDSNELAIIDLNLARTIPNGTRNTTLASLAGSMRKRGMSQRAVEAALLAENSESCTPPLSVDEVRKIAASIATYPIGQPLDAIEPTHVPEELSPALEPDILEGDYIADLTFLLVNGTSLPPQYVRELINFFLAAVSDGLLGYPRHPDLPSRRYLAIISRYPQAGKGESWKRVTDSLLPVHGSKLKLLNGTGIGSGQYLAKELQEYPRSIIFWDESSQLFQVTGHQNSTLFSSLKSLYEGTSHWTGSLTNKKYGTDDAHLSVLMHSTERTFKEGFALRGAVGDGLLSRFTLAYSAGMHAVAEWEPRNFTEEKKLVASLASLIPTAPFIPAIADNARERIHEYARTINNPEHPHFAYTRRLLELVKVDVLIRCIYSGSREITLPMVTRGIAWGEHQLALRLHFWPPDATDRAAAMSQVLLHRLRKGTASANDLRRAASVDRDGSHETFTRSLSALTRSGKVIVLGKNRKNQSVYGLEPDDDFAGPAQPEI